MTNKSVVIKIECINWGNDREMRGMFELFRETKPSDYWVAEIVGTHREFSMAWE